MERVLRCLEVERVRTQLRHAHEAAGTRAAGGQRVGLDSLGHMRSLERVQIINLHLYAILAVGNGSRESQITPPFFGSP